MRTLQEVESCVDIWRDENGRIDIDRLWNRFTDGSPGWMQP
jgi:hypothetical protein